MSIWEQHLAHNMCSMLTFRKQPTLLSNHKTARHHDFKCNLLWSPHLIYWFFSWIWIVEIHFYHPQLIRVLSGQNAFRTIESYRDNQLVSLLFRNVSEWRGKSSSEPLTNLFIHSWVHLSYSHVTPAIYWASPGAANRTTQWSSCLGGDLIVGTTLREDNGKAEWEAL